MTHRLGGQLRYRMPFEPLFWRDAEHREISHSWSLPVDAANSKAPAKVPQGVQGFIVALPTGWTRGEDNLFTKSHIAIIAVNEQPATQHTLALNSPGKKDSSA